MIDGIVSNVLPDNIQIAAVPRLKAPPYHDGIRMFSHCWPPGTVSTCTRPFRTALPRLGPERVNRILVIGQGPVLGELPVRIDPVGLREHHVQMPVIPVRRDPGEDPAVRIVGEDILRLAPQPPAGQVPDLPEVLEDRVPTPVVAAEGVVSTDMPDDIFGEQLPACGLRSRFEQGDCLADETVTRML